MKLKEKTHSTIVIAFHHLDISICAFKLGAYNLLSGFAPFLRPVSSFEVVQLVTGMENWTRDVSVNSMQQISEQNTHP